MHSEFLKQQAKHCRFLAEKADPFFKRRLLDLAVRCDDRLDLALRGPPRTFGIPGNLLGSAIAFPTGHCRQLSYITRA
jgi:hypothetical protein